MKIAQVQTRRRMTNKEQNNKTFYLDFEWELEIDSIVL